MGVDSGVLAGSGTGALAGDGVPLVASSTSRPALYVVDRVQCRRLVDFNVIVLVIPI